MSIVDSNVDNNYQRDDGLTDDSLSSICSNDDDCDDSTMQRMSIDAKNGGDEIDVRSVQVCTSMFSPFRE